MAWAEEHGQRPAAAALGEHVHEVRHLRIIERLMGHDVAPMARRIADGQQNRLVLLHHKSERLLSQRIPLHGVVGVLPEIGAGFTDEPVGHHAHPLE